MALNEISKLELFAHDLMLLAEALWEAGFKDKARVFVNRVEKMFELDLLRFNYFGQFESFWEAQRVEGFRESLWVREKVSSIRDWVDRKSQKGKDSE